MIFGLIFRFVRDLLRNRGVPVPDVGMRRQMPVMQLTWRLTDDLAARASAHVDRRTTGAANP